MSDKVVSINVNASYLEVCKAKNSLLFRTVASVRVMDGSKCVLETRKPDDLDYYLARAK